MTIENLTIAEARELHNLFGAGTESNIAVQTAFQIGENYLIRTVSMTNTGKVVSVSEHEVVLEQAAWVADTGRFSAAIESCVFSEVEPFPDGKQVIVGRSAIIDAVQINTLPRNLK